MNAPQGLPDGVELVRTTDVFDEARHPPGLLRSHRVAAGVWGRLVVYTGALEFVFDEPPDGSPADAAGRFPPMRVAAGGSVVIPPGREHHVEFDGPVTFAIEFYRHPDRPGSDGPESSGLTA